MCWPIFSFIYKATDISYLAFISFDVHVFHYPARGGTLYAGVGRDMPIKVVLRYHLILHV